MKTASVRIRLENAEKEKIKIFAEKAETSISEICRQSLVSAMAGGFPVAQERQVCAAARRAANQVLQILDTRPIDIPNLRLAVATLRDSAQDVVRCR